MKTFAQLFNETIYSSRSKSRNRLLQGKDLRKTWITIWGNYTSLVGVDNNAPSPNSRRSKLQNRQPREKPIPHFFEKADRLRAFENKQKHQRFDELWNTNKGLVYWWASKLSKLYGGIPSEYVGMLVLRFNYVIYHYDESKGTLGQLFQLHLHKWIWKYMLRYESETKAIHNFNHNATTGELNEQQFNFATYEKHRHLYSTPGKEEKWAIDLLENFDSPEDLWAFLCRGMPEQWKKLIKQKFVQDLSFTDIAQSRGVSVQAVAQQYHTVMKRIRERIKVMEPFTNLFSN